MIFTEIRLQVNRLFPLYNFYKNVLELRVTDDDDNHFTIHTVVSKLIFEKTNDPLSYPFYHFAFNIPSNRIEEAHDWLKKRIDLLWLKDYNSPIADFGNWRAKSVYFLDPAGNIVEFIARADRKDIINEPFSSNHVRNVSEIGLVFSGHSFRESIEQLLKKYDLKYFSKQPRLENFCVIGDDEGLFIIVPESRNWYPCDNKPAGIFPITITFLVDNIVKKINLG